MRGLHDGPRARHHFDVPEGLHLEQGVANDVRPDTQACRQLPNGGQAISGSQPFGLDEGQQFLDDIHRRSDCCGDHGRIFLMKRTPPGFV